MITGPFLLAIPLAVWTLRLTVAPRPHAAERAVAWSLTLTSLVMTLLCMGYCLSLRQPRFILPIAVTLVVIGMVAACVLWLWRMRRAWPPALLGMTGAWAANTTLTSLVLLSRLQSQVGIVVALLVVLAQLALLVVCAWHWGRAGAAPVALTRG
jgi:hypothetical protein